MRVSIQNNYRDFKDGSKMPKKPLIYSVLMKKEKLGGIKKQKPQLNPSGTFQLSL